MSRRDVVLDTRAVCTDCGCLVANWYFLDPDKVENVAGMTLCKCGSQRSMRRAKYL